VKLDKLSHAEVGLVYFPSISGKPLYHWQGKLFMKWPDMKNQLPVAVAAPGSDCLHSALSALYSFDVGPHGFEEWQLLLLLLLLLRRLALFCLELHVQGMW
jgi:hypothetical protein